MPDAGAVSEFYAAVVGGKSRGMDVGGDEDFCPMPPGAKESAAGSCPVRGENKDRLAQGRVTRSAHICPRA